MPLAWTLTTTLALLGFCPFTLHSCTILPYVWWIFLILLCILSSWTQKAVNICVIPAVSVFSVNRGNPVKLWAWFGHRIPLVDLKVDFKIFKLIFEFSILFWIFINWLFLHIRLFGQGRNWKENHPQCWGTWWQRFCQWGHPPLGWIWLSVF